MKINIYKTQKVVEKTYEVDNYDLMYGTVQDILEVLEEGIPQLTDEESLVKLVIDNRGKFEDLLLDVFADQGLTRDELRRVKLKELIPVFVSLFEYVQESFKAKN